MSNEPSDSPTPQSSSPPSPAADSSAVSATGSASESPSFFGDAGPQFDPELAAAEGPPVAPPAAEPKALIEWEQDTIEALLGLKGRALHAAIGVAEEDWRYTELDLAAIAPPLTRICNRYEPVQRLAAHADPLLLGMALFGYGVRSLEERAAMLRSLEAADTVPIEPLEEAAPPPAPPTPPRQTQHQPSVQGPPPAPASPTPPAPPRPGEADVDPELVDWTVGG